MTNRRHISKRERVSLFQREKGFCHHCGGLVTPGQAWQLSHKIPLALGGSDDESNWGVIHTRPCHETVTWTVDVPAIAQAKRREAKHLGVKPTPTFQSRGFARHDREPKRLTKTCAGETSLARRIVTTGETE